MVYIGVIPRVTDEEWEETKGYLFETGEHESVSDTVAAAARELFQSKLDEEWLIEDQNYMLAAYEEECKSTANTA